VTRGRTIALLFTLSAGLASPAHGIDELGDITIPRVENESLGTLPLAVFPHWIHRTRYKCFVCHDTLFQMQAGADQITMDAMEEGKFCAVCHDGKTAFGIGFDTCEKCHRAPSDGS